MTESGDREGVDGGLWKRFGGRMDGIKNHRWWGRMDMRWVPCWTCEKQTPNIRSQ